MGVKTFLEGWPVYRQLTGSDPLGRGEAVMSAKTASLTSRTTEADRVVKSICPYCAVGCGQNVYVKDEKVVQIEGDPDSPISRGRLCPKGSATLQLTTGDARMKQVLYRRPYGDRVGGDRPRHGDGHGGRAGDQDPRGDVRSGTPRTASGYGRHHGHRPASAARRWTTRRTTSSRSCSPRSASCRWRTRPGSATARRSRRWAPRSAAAARTTYMQDLQNSDCIVIEGSNFAEAHPVGFQWVMEAKARGAKVIHVDPRFSRTSALADVFVPIRAGTDIAWLGALIHYVLENEKYFHEYVVNYTNAATLVSEDFRDTEDLDGVFSGLDRGDPHYDADSWQYDGDRGHGGVRSRGLAVRLPYRSERRRHGTERRQGGPGRERDAAHRPDPAGPAVRLPGPQAALRPLHRRDGRAGLRRPPEQFSSGRAG